MIRAVGGAVGGAREEKSAPEEELWAELEMRRPAERATQMSARPFVSHRVMARPSLSQERAPLRPRARALARESRPKGSGRKWAVSFPLHSPGRGGGGLLGLGAAAASPRARAEVRSDTLSQRAIHHPAERAAGNGGRATRAARPRHGHAVARLPESSRARREERALGSGFAVGPRDRRREGSCGRSSRRGAVGGARDEKSCRRSSRREELGGRSSR